MKTKHKQRGFILLSVYWLASFVMVGGFAYVDKTIHDKSEAATVAVKQENSLAPQAQSEAPAVLVADGKATQATGQ